MKKYLSALAAAMLLVVSFSTGAGAQTVGTVESDPPTVPAEGEYTVTATGSGFLPDSELLVGSCTSPAETLVPGVSDADAISAAAVAISPLEHCDVANALTVTTDADGNFSQQVTATIGPNFFLTAGTLDGAQSGAVWIPIVDAAADGELAVTGVESGLLAGAGAALIALGAAAVHLARRSED